MTESIFLDVVGDSSVMRVLQYFIEGRDFDHTMTDLINAGVSWETLHIVVPKLLEHEVIIKVREIGRAKLYKINKENPAARKLLELYDSLIKIELEKRKEEVLVTA